MAQGNYDEEHVADHADDDFEFDVGISYGLWDADAGGIDYDAAYGDCVLCIAEELCGRDYGGD